MPLMRPDPTFYPSPKLAMQSPPEKIAYLTLINPTGKGASDAIGVVDVDPDSNSYGRLIGQTDMPHAGDELHHFGWNACSSHLCPYAPHPHMERRYLIVPGIHSSRIHILDTKPDPRNPKIVKVIAGEELAHRTGYAAPHTVHCGPDGIYERARRAGPQRTGWHVHARWRHVRHPRPVGTGSRTAAARVRHVVAPRARHTGDEHVGTPNMVKDGVNPELLLGAKYGNALHVWDLRRRRHLQELKLGDEQQMVLELRPAHDPTHAYGFAGVVLSLKDLSSSVWLWYRKNGSNGSHGSEGEFAIKKVIEIPAEPTDPEKLPPILQGFKAAAPLVTDINLSLDDRYLYVSCFGTGELIQYDVSDPFHPKKVSSLHLCGMVRRAAHPREPQKALNGGPQMIEISRDGKRLYLTNSLYSPWDEPFYPDGVRGWMAKINVPASGGMELDRRFFFELKKMRPHQVRLEGGDASSDSYCYA
jgi:methanethiol oxidase